MNITQYIIGKYLEKAGIESLKHNIRRNISLNQYQETLLLNCLKGFSMARDAQDMLSIFLNRKY